MRTLILAAAAFALVSSASVAQVTCNPTCPDRFTIRDGQTTTIFDGNGYTAFAPDGTPSRGVRVGDTYLPIMPMAIDRPPQEPARVYLDGNGYTAFAPDGTPSRGVRVGDTYLPLAK